MLLENNLRSIRIRANLRINDQIREYRELCAKRGCDRPYHHFAFGQSPFSPPPKVVEALRTNADKHDYLPTAGLPELRESIALYYREKFSLDCDASQVVVSPGSKEMISMVLATLQGAVIIPSPSWVSYLPQARILGKEVISIRLSEEDDYKLGPDKLERCLREAKFDQYILILNNPNNPTGVVYGEDELKALSDVCRRHNVVVVSDEIYARTSFDFEKFVSMGRLYPEKTIITGGLSKDRSSGGYRLGVGIFPKNPAGLIEDILKIAGTTYSCVAAPIQFAGLAAYSMDDDVESYIDDCAGIHALVGNKTAELLAEIPGVKTSAPQGAFYLFIDFNDYRGEMIKLGLKTCAEFCEHLIMVEHTALLPGENLLLPEDDFAVRGSYVDYDGDKLLAEWRKARPSGREKEDSFFTTNCPLIKDGIENIGLYLAQVRERKMPVHV